MKATSEQIIIGFIKGRPDLAEELLVRSGVGFDKNVSADELLNNVVSAYQYSPKFRKEFQQVFNGVVEETYTNFAGGEYNRAYQIQSGSSGFNDMNWDLKDFAGEFENSVGEFSDFAGEFFNQTGNLGFPPRQTSLLDRPTPSLLDKPTSGSILTTGGSDTGGSSTGSGRLGGIISFFKNTFSTEGGEFDTEKANKILNTGFGILNSVRNKGGNLTTNYSSNSGNDSQMPPPEGWWNNLLTWQKVAIVGVPVIVVGLVAWKLSKKK
jgi:hypothetical protein